MTQLSEINFAGISIFVVPQNVLQLFSVKEMKRNDDLSFIQYLQYCHKCMYLILNAAIV